MKFQSAFLLLSSFSFAMSLPRVQDLSDLQNLFTGIGPAEGFVVVNIGLKDNRHQLPLWKRDTMSDKLPDDDGAVLFGPEGNEDPPERKEIYFNNVYKPRDIELTDNTAATGDNLNTNQIEERATQSNEQLTNGLQDKKNEINRQNIPVIFFSPRWPSKL